MRTCRTLPKYTVSRAHVICSGPGIWRQYRPTFKLGGKVDCQIVKLFSWPQASNSSSLVPFSGSATATVIYKVYKRKALENTMTVVSFESESTMLTAPVLCTCMSSADNSHGLNWSLQNFRASSRRDYVHQIYTWTYALKSITASSYHSAVSTQCSFSECKCQKQIAGWRGSATGRALDSRSVGRRFKSYSRQRCVTTLGKLFTPMCLCHQAV